MRCANCSELTEREHERGANEADADERRDQVGGRYPGRAHYCVLGSRDQLRKGEKRPDQHRDRKELVDVPRRRQQDVGDHEFQGIGAPTEIPDLIEHVEKRKKHHQRDDDQSRRDEDLGCDVSPQRSHRVSRKTENSISRR